MTLARGLRIVAVLIAVMAFVDPVLSRAGLVRPSVVVLPASEADRGLAALIAERLNAGFDVSSADRPDAAAYVLAGDGLPDGWRPPVEAAVFAVTPDRAAAGVQVLRVTVPAEASVDSIVPVRVDLRVDGTGDRDVTVALIVDGVRVLAATAHLAGEDTRTTVPLAFVPPRPDVLRVRVEATVPGRSAARADTLLDVTSRIWRVLAFDGRPSYAATFVRRALETDPRFLVTTRVVTSRGSAIQTGTAPASLADAGALNEFDVVVVGAVDSLGTADATALERYLRDRHGAVVLLPELPQGIVLSRLTGESVWREDRRAAAARVASVETWTASEFLWPDHWSPLVAPLGTFVDEPQGKDPVSRYPVWQMPVGGGRLVVSSAVDGWRSRAGAALGFSAFWRATAAAVANATPPMVGVDVSRRVLLPGGAAEVVVRAFSAGEPTLRLRDSRGAVSLVRLWPSDVPRTWTGAFRAPEVPGRYRLEATIGGGTAGAEFLVLDSESGHDMWMAPTLEGNGLAALAASSHRGAVIPAAELDTLAARLGAAIEPVRTPQAWYPMRSVWWLVPFTMCAAGEWWLRRRRGER